jgi:signal transduction histidine kinase
MRKWIILSCLQWWGASATGRGVTDNYFYLLSRLEFTKAKEYAAHETDSLLRTEMEQLADILFHDGQVERSLFLPARVIHSERKVLLVINSLNKGYLDLFYNKVKGNAYKQFYNAYRIAKDTGEPTLVKACLMAILRYHHFEIAQNSDVYLPYLNEFESLQAQEGDRFWVIIYKMIFLSKSLSRPVEEYLRFSEELDKCEQMVTAESPLLTYVFYEKALRFDFEGDQASAEAYYRKTIRQAADFPYLRYHRFFSELKLMMIQSAKKNFDSARLHLCRARNEINRSDSLRSVYQLNLYSSFFFYDQKKYDSAYLLLKKAYAQDFQLDFRRNTLEINRLNVELETREKENANLLLRQEKWWLLSSLVVSFLLIITGYFAYAGRQAQSKMQLQQKEVQAMKLEKQLKEQEMLGIDLMIEGQEKERQRIANDLHDDLGAQLAAMKIKLESLEKQLTTESAPQQLVHETTSLLNEAYQKVRSMAHARHAGINAQDGLLPAVRNFASKVSVANRLAIQVEEHGMDTRLENSLEITLFRIIQELITNVIKHAQASEVIIHLTQHETSINVMVEDNGTGFDIATIQPGETMGLYSIQKRIENLGGQVTIDSIAQKGTTVIIDIPLA